MTGAEARPLSALWTEFGVAVADYINGRAFRDLGALRAEIEASIVSRERGRTADLVDVGERLWKWLDHERERSEVGARDKRFITLAEANAADAKNYSAMADDLRAALDAAKSEGEKA